MSLTFNGVSLAGGLTFTFRPSAPIIGTATATTGTTATVTFTSPAFNGGATITSYTAVSSPGGITGTVNQSGSGTITISGLAELTSYTFTVYATNSEGNSATSSASNQITTSTYANNLFSQARAPLVLNEGGELFVWESSAYGSAGLGDTIYRSAPVQIPGSWLSASTGGSLYTHAGGVKTDGTLWAWGSGIYGGLGDGSTINRSSPVQIGSATDWMVVYASETQTYGIKNDNTLWATGWNINGELGDNTKISKSSPVQILGSWSMISSGGGGTGSVGGGHGIKPDGSLWGWGPNLSFGQVGNNSGSDVSSPIQIGTDSWTKVSAGQCHRLALRLDGTLWVWGKGSEGQLGLGTITVRRSPVQLGSDTWLDCCAGSDSSYGIKSDGSLWVWGKNTSGQLGIYNDYTNKTTPQRIGSATSWRKLGSTAEKFIAADVDGKIWVATTNNVAGYLGQGDTVNRSGPVQVTL